MSQILQIKFSRKENVVGFWSRFWNGSENFLAKRPNPNPPVKREKLKIFMTWRAQLFFSESPLELSQGWFACGYSPNEGNNDYKTLTPENFDQEYFEIQLPVIWKESKPKWIWLVVNFWTSEKEMERKITKTLFDPFVIKRLNRLLENQDEELKFVSAFDSLVFDEDQNVKKQYLDRLVVSDPSSEWMELSNNWMDIWKEISEAKFEISEHNIYQFQTRLKMKEIKDNLHNFIIDTKSSGNMNKLNYNGSLNIENLDLVQDLNLISPI